MWSLRSCPGQVRVSFPRSLPSFHTSETVWQFCVCVCLCAFFLYWPWSSGQVLQDAEQTKNNFMASDKNVLIYSKSRRCLSRNAVLVNLANTSEKSSGGNMRIPSIFSHNLSIRMARSATTLSFLCRPLCAVHPLVHWSHAFLFII